MQFDQIIVVKETRENEGRVALTPSIAALLTTKGYRILVEEDAGLKAGFTNNDVSIINKSNYPQIEPRTSSEIYAQCVYHLLLEIMTSDGKISFENKLVQEIWVTHQQKKHAKLYNQYNN